MDTGIGEDRLAQLAHVQLERRLLEGLLHGAGTEDAQVAAVPGRAAVALRLGEFFQADLLGDYLLTMSWNIWEKDNYVLATIIL